MFFRAGFPVIGNIVELIENNALWFSKVLGIGYETGRRLLWVFQREGFISRDCEAYKASTDRDYYRELEHKRWLEKYGK